MTQGKSSEYDQAASLIEGFKANFVLIDKDYDANRLIEPIRVNGAVAVIPERKHRQEEREQRDKTATTAFFKQAMDDNGLPSQVVIDKSGANNAGVENINILLFLVGLLYFIDILKVKYLNNVVEQDHRFIMKIIKPMMGFNDFYSASATLAGIETAYMIKKRQFTNNLLPAHLWH